MSNRLSSKLSAQQSALAETVIREFELDGFSIEFKPETQSLMFKKDFKVVEVVTSLIEANRWGDVRHLFRAVLKSGPQHHIFAAENEWSRGDY